MIDLSKLSMDELQELEKKIADIKSQKTRTYRVSFDITFRADRTDDLSDPESFSDHVIDDIDAVFKLRSPEQISNVQIKEI